MTDKEQIIMDGVDVKNCKGIDLGLFPLAKCKFLKFKTSDGGIAGIWCSDHTNCYFKQLARKTQECESLKEEIEILKDNFDTVTRDCNELIEELRQECEELKGKYKNVLDLAKQNADANEYCLQELEQENYRYRKALEEIEKIVKINCKGICGRKFEDCNDTSCFSAELLNIINKVKGDNR